MIEIDPWIVNLWQEIVLLYMKLITPFYFFIIFGIIYYGLKDG